MLEDYFCLFIPNCTQNHLITYVENNITVTSFSFYSPFSQATGVVFILICQALEVPKHFKNAKCQDISDGKVPDLQYAMYFMTASAVAMAFLIIVAFYPPYKRLDMERRKAAQRILQGGARQRLPSIPSPSDSDNTHSPEG